MRWSRDQKTREEFLEKQSKGSGSPSLSRGMSKSTGENAVLKFGRRAPPFFSFVDDVGLVGFGFCLGAGADGGLRLDDETLRDVDFGLG